MSDMADSCQQTYSFLPNWLPVVFVVFKSRVLSETEPVWRRLITLIFAGWLPPDLASSRSCLCLSTWVQPKVLSNEVSEGSPDRGCASETTLELMIEGSCSLLPW